MNTLLTVILAVVIVILLIAVVVTTKKYRKSVGNAAYWKNIAATYNSDLAMANDSLVTATNTIAEKRFAISKLENTIKVAPTRKVFKDEAITLLQDQKLKGYQVAGMKECVSLIRKM